MINNEFIAKIEGHGSLKIDWGKGEVKLNIHEGERLFEGILVGRTAEEMHWITPRICGVCPVAHNLASLKALEAALGIEVNQTTVLLRDLMQCGQMVQSHALHLFFLSLPDYLGIDRGTELNQKNPAAFQDALSLKEISDEIVHLTAGRNVHPTTSAIGGFHKIPGKIRLKKLLEKVKKNQEAAQRTIKLCIGLDYPELKVELELVAIKGDEIASVNSKDCHCEEKDASPTMKQSRGISTGLPRSLRSLAMTRVDDYKKDIEEEVRDYSTAKFARYKKKEVLCGALARLAVGESGICHCEEAAESGQRSNLANRDCFASLAMTKKVDFSNPFHNNLAQAIEILFYLKKAEELINKLSDMEMDKNIVEPAKNPSLKGIGAVEAPRGGLYHEVHLVPSTGSGNNIITYANIITPTVQNLTSIEKSAKALLEQQKNRSQEELERLLTMLVRAYDPCITCSVH